MTNPISRAPRAEQTVYRERESQDEVPDVKTVPIEPSKEMLIAGGDAVHDFYSEDGPYPRTKAMWRAMLEAAPKNAHEVPTCQVCGFSSWHWPIETSPIASCANCGQPIHYPKPAAPSPPAPAGVGEEAERIVNEINRNWTRDFRRDPHLIDAIASALISARQAALEEAAEIADTFACGGCGMDGKAGAAIRALSRRGES